MLYPKANCCPLNTDEKMPPSQNSVNVRAENDNSSNIPEYESGSKHEMMNKIREIDFAIIDLNLFLDTHPNCKDALELFTKLAATSKSMKSDYQRKYGPLYASNCHNAVPFEWVSDDYKWPWQKQEVK